MRFNSILRDDRGQLLPFMAVCVLILLLVTAATFGLSVIYLQRTKIRDAVDAAALAGIATARQDSTFTFYGERLYEKYGYDGQHRLVVVDSWYEKTTSGEERFLTMDHDLANREARKYLDRNLRLLATTSYKLKSFDVKVIAENRHVTVTTHRPHTEGISNQRKEVDASRWIKVRVSGTVELPLPVGRVAGVEKLSVQMNGAAEKRLR